jgi:hypothetical protein
MYQVCDEVEGAHTWDIMGRGISARVITDSARRGDLPKHAQVEEVRARLPYRGTL